MHSGSAKRALSRGPQGLVLAGGIATGAWRLHALSGTGAFAATLVGATIYACMGLRGSIATVAYFGSASALGRLPSKGQQVQRRGNRRDAVQVLANGGPAAAFALSHALSAGRAQSTTSAAFYGSLAAAAADTWATEIGTRFGGSPRSLTTGRKVAPGESGGVTTAGLAASTVAALAIAVFAQTGAPNPQVMATSCATGGVAGSLADSFLGARLQERFWCESCLIGTELPLHNCGRRTRRISGVPGMTNDVVNLLAVVTGGFTAAAWSAALTELTGHIGSRVELVPASTSSRLPNHTDAS